MLETIIKKIFVENIFVRVFQQLFSSVLSTQNYVNYHRATRVQYYSKYFIFDIKPSKQKSVFILLNLYTKDDSRSFCLPSPILFSAFRGPMLENGPSEELS
jgi:hypothetical protein